MCLLQPPDDASCSAASAALAPRTLRATHAPDNTPLELGKKRAAMVRQETDMPSAAQCNMHVLRVLCFACALTLRVCACAEYSELTSPAAWAVARYAGTGTDALCVPQTACI